jgi:hypothetical protein
VLLAVPIALIAAITVVDILAPPNVHLGPFLAAAPAVTASFAGPRATAGVGALAVMAQVLVAAVRTSIVDLNHTFQIITLILMAGFATFFAARRERHDRELIQLRSVATAAQEVAIWTTTPPWWRSGACHGSYERRPGREPRWSGTPPRRNGRRHYTGAVLSGRNTPGRREGLNREGGCGRVRRDRNIPASAGGAATAVTTRASELLVLSGELVWLAHSPTGSRTRRGHRGSPPVFES